MIKDTTQEIKEERKNREKRKKDMCDSRHTTIRWSQLSACVGLLKIINYCNDQK